MSMGFTFTGVLLAFWEWFRSSWMIAQKAFLGALYQPLVMIGAIAYGLAQLVGYITTSLETCFASVGAVASSIPSNSTGAASSWFDTMNAFLPFDSFITWSELLISVAVACMIYRFIKSWIPTVSG